MKYSFNKSILILILLVVVIIIYNNYSKNIDGFENQNYTNWSPDLIRRFNKYQTTMNNNVNQLMCL